MRVTPFRSSVASQILFDLCLPFMPHRKSMLFIIHPAHMNSRPALRYTQWRFLCFIIIRSFYYYYYYSCEVKIMRKHDRRNIVGYHRCGRRSEVLLFVVLRRCNVLKWRYIKLPMIALFCRGKEGLKLATRGYPWNAKWSGKRSGEKSVDVLME